MSTGSVAVVIAQTPNRFHGINTIGKIFFITDLVLFVIFTALMCTRFIVAPRRLLVSLHHPVEGLFFGAYWVSIALILNCAQSYGVSNSGPWLVKALEVLFWIYCAFALFVAIFLYYVMFAKERLQVAEAMPAWIFPIYPLLVVGPLAGTLIPSQPHHAAYPMWVGGVMLQGLAWTVALMMYTIYTQRLMSSVLPPPPIRPGMFISVGPAGMCRMSFQNPVDVTNGTKGYTSAALISLATQAPNVLPAHAFHIGSDFADGHVVKVFGIVSGTFVLLFAFWFFCISTVAVITGIRRMDFTLNWWAFVFPNAGLTLGAIQLGKVFNSPGINGICSALTILLVILWLVTAVAHIQAVVQRKILWPGKDEDQDTE